MKVTIRITFKQLQEAVRQLPLAAKAELMKQLEADTMDEVVAEIKAYRRERYAREQQAKPSDTSTTSSA